VSVREQVEAWCAETEQEVLLADGFEGALLGLAQQFNTILAIYDRDACLRILVERDGMTPEEAEEFFAFNVQGSSVGEGTPAVLVWRPVRA
jgi:hypothetical protein